jgi:FeS assembly SUF system regulator
MLRMSRLTDYGTVVLSYIARRRDTLSSAADVAAGTHVATPTVAKLLKMLARAGLVSSVRGAQGGYTLAREPERISAAEIITALEGPVALTECSAEARSCDLESICSVGSAWQRINLAIQDALAEISLAQLMRAGRDGLPAMELGSAVTGRDRGRSDLHHERTGE